MLLDAKNHTIVKLLRCAEHLQTRLTNECKTQVPQVAAMITQSGASLLIGDCVLWDSEADDLEKLTPAVTWKAWMWHVNTLCEPFVGEQETPAVTDTPAVFEPKATGLRRVIKGR